MSDGASGMLFARLLTVVDGCLVAEPTRRMTVPHVLELLTTLQRDVAAAAAGAGSGAASSPVTVSPPPVLATSVYDVLAIVSALETLKIDTAAVIDAIGGTSTSSLDALRAAGVPYVKCLAVKKALTEVGPAIGPVKVGTTTLWSRHGFPDRDVAVVRVQVVVR